MNAHTILKALNRLETKRARQREALDITIAEIAMYQLQLENLRDKDRQEAEAVKGAKK